MQKTEKIGIATLALLLTLSMLANIPSAFAAQGPRTDDLLIQFYTNMQTAYTALKADEIDLMAFTGWSAGLPLHDGEQFDDELYQDAITDPNINLAPIKGNDIVGFDFNNNCTIPWYPNIRSPMNYRSFRQALAYLVNKDYIVDVIKGGLACRIDVPIPCSQARWWNPAVTGINYPYTYNPLQAVALFDTNGFLQGSTPNPHYNPARPDSAEFIRTYPPDHPQKPGQDLDPLIFKLRIDDLPRHYAAWEFMYEMWNAGIPVTYIEEDKASLYHQVMGERNYHIYTSGWVVKKWPIYLYQLYHLDFWRPYGPNYVTGNNCLGEPNYPLLDEALENLWYAPSYADSQGACDNAQQIMIDECISVWLYSSQSYVAYRNLLGIVNMDGYGPINEYTFLNAYKADQTPIRVGTANPPIALNVMYSDWISDWICLDRIYTHLMNEAPYNLAADQPWIARDWEIETWLDPQDGLNKTKVTYWLNPKAFWVTPVHGVMDGQVTAHDVEFSIWMPYALDQGPDTGWHYPDVKDIHHTKIVDEFTIEVYFNVSSYWAVYWIGEQLPLIPKHLWLNNFCELSYYEEVLIQPWLPCEKFRLPIDDIVQVADVYLDGIPLVEGEDYHIVAKDGCHNWFWWQIPANPGQLLEIWYWTPIFSPVGYYPGNYPWQEKLEGCGTHYVTDITPGAGGYMVLRRNPFFFLETPPLGEIDWIYYFDPGPKPRTGCYKVNIYDIVLACGAYGSQGSGVPDPNWLPGADVAPEECKIDIFDIVTITGQYGKPWGCDP